MSNFLEKQVTKQKNLKERYQSSLSKYSSQNDHKGAVKKRKRKVERLQEKDIYLPQNLDKITYGDQYVASNRQASIEHNLIKRSTKVQLADASFRQTPYEIKKLLRPGKYYGESNERSRSTLAHKTYDISIKKGSIQIEQELGLRNIS